MIKLISNKSVYEKTEVDSIASNLNKKIKDIQSNVYTAKGGASYAMIKPSSIYDLPDPSTLNVNALIKFNSGGAASDKFIKYVNDEPVSAEGDIIPSGSIIQVILIGSTKYYHWLDGIQVGWIYNNEHVFISDENFVDEEGTQCNIGTNFVVVELDREVNGSKWGFDILAHVEGFSDVDSELSLVSENPVQNKVITAEIYGIEDELDSFTPLSVETINSYFD